MVLAHRTDEWRLSNKWNNFERECPRMDKDEWIQKGTNPRTKKTYASSHTETVTWLAQIRLSWTYLLARFSRQLMQHNIQEMKWLCVNEASKWVEGLQARKRQIQKLRKWCHPPFFGREGLDWVEKLQGSRWLVSECKPGQWETGSQTGKEANRPWPVRWGKVKVELIMHLLGI